MGITAKAADELLQTDGMSSGDNVEPSRLRFSRNRRLTRSSEFLRVKIDGRVQRGALLILGVLDVPAAGGFRAGFVTSKRVGGAVVRNRIRRRLREIVRHYQHGLKDDVWMVLIARPPAATASYAALEHEWLRLANRALILAPSCA
ncbi:MAG: ribonuclease P protein component [Verrucomicrobiota bacterium]|nr:ribonuclease P protein component [Verrucomicrobiota bacterium]